MTTISATASATQPTAALTASGPAATSSSSSNANIGDRFLTLLVTQLRNQDPLNPWTTRR